MLTREVVLDSSHNAMGTQVCAKMPALMISPLFANRLHQRSLTLKTCARQRVVAVEGSAESLITRRYRPSHPTHRSPRKQAIRKRERKI